jgi:uncharacterized protein
LDKYLPGQHLIAAFGNGGFRFADMSHQGSLLILPERMQVWTPRLLTDVAPEHFSAIINARSNFDMLLIGTGAHLSFLDPATNAALKEHQLSFEVMTTSSAVHVYNVVLAEGRRVAAALLAVP